MATRHEAKLALWEASKKDDSARAFIVSFMAEKSVDGPGGFVAVADLAEAVKAIAKPKQVKKVK